MQLGQLFLFSKDSFMKLPHMAPLLHMQNNCSTFDIKKPKRIFLWSKVATDKNWYNSIAKQLLYFSHLVLIQNRKWSIERRSMLNYLKITLNCIKLKNDKFVHPNQKREFTAFPYYFRRNVIRVDVPWKWFVDTWPFVERTMRVQCNCVNYMIRW